MLADIGVDADSHERTLSENDLAEEKKKKGGWWGGGETTNHTCSSLAYRNVKNSGLKFFLLSAGVNSK